MTSDFRKGFCYLSRSIVGVAAVCALIGVAHAAQAPYAETVILNGMVITADSDDPENVSIKQAIAIYGDRIMAVGSNEEIKELVADWTEVIDAKGNSVLPGLIDTHNHIYETSTGFPWVIRSMPDMMEISMRSETGKELVANLEKAVTARAGQIPPGQWIRVRLNPAGLAVKEFGKTIMNNPEKYFTTDVMAILDEAAKKEFMYGLSTDNE